MRGGGCIVGDHDHGLAEAVDQVAEQVEHLAGGPQIQGAGRFVSENDRGSGHQRPGDRGPLLLAAGQLGGAAVQPAAQPDPLDQHPQPVPRHRPSA